MLKINNLTYNYKDNNSIQPYTFNLDISSGDIIGILGESGSGKSTMLDLISGFLEADNGSVSFKGDELLNHSIENRPITILFQHHNLFEHLSIERNILLGLTSKANASSGESKQIDDILREMNLTEHKYKMPSELSGGQQQRVALARALIRQTPILLLDEPFTGLDYDTRINMLKIVKKITKKRGLYTIMVTHEIEDCKLIATKTYKMNNGILKVENLIPNKI